LLKIHTEVIILYDIGRFAFKNCKSLTFLDDLFGKLKCIDEGAFSGCTSLLAIHIGNSVISIGAGAFSNCESLTYIYYYNTIEQWKKVKLGECWNLNVPTKIVHCINDENEDVEISI
jgi:hypothetical protein